MNKEELAWEGKSHIRHMRVWKMYREEKETRRLITKKPVSQSRNLSFKRGIKKRKRGNASRPQSGLWKNVSGGEVMLRDTCRDRLILEMKGTARRLKEAGRGEDDVPEVGSKSTVEPEGEGKRGKVLCRRFLRNYPEGHLIKGVS